MYVLVYEHTWLTIDVGPSGHFFYQDFYGTQTNYVDLVRGLGQKGGNGLRDAVTAFADKQHRENAWHTCVCYQTDDQWVSTGSSQYTWGGGAYNGHDQCWDTNCGNGW